MLLHHNQCLQRLLFPHQDQHLQAHPFAKQMSEWWFGHDMPDKQSDYISSSLKKNASSRKDSSDK